MLNWDDGVCKKDSPSFDIVSFQVWCAGSIVVASFQQSDGVEVRFDKLTLAITLKRASEPLAGLHAGLQRDLGAFFDGYMWVLLGAIHLQCTAEFVLQA